MKSPNNPVFKQLLKEIASQASVGRSDLSWGIVYDTRRKNMTEAALNPDDETDAEKTDEPAPEEAAPEAPIAKKPTAAAKPAPTVPAPKAPAIEPEAAPAPAADPTKAKADASKAQAELERAKAEKAQAEEELDQNAYIKLNSPSGIKFLLGKLVDRAVKTNTSDALASEFVQKLKITTPEDFQLFSDEMIPYKNIPGMVELIGSMQNMVSNKPDTTED